MCVTCLGSSIDLSVVDDQYSAPQVHDQFSPTLLLFICPAFGLPVWSAWFAAIISMLSWIDHFCTSSCSIWLFKGRHGTLLSGLSYLSWITPLQRVISQVSNMGFPCIICLSEFLFRPTELIPTVGILPLTSYIWFHWVPAIPIIRIFQPLRPYPTSPTITTNPNQFDHIQSVWPFRPALLLHFPIWFCWGYVLHAFPVLLFLSVPTRVRSYLTSFTAPFSQFAQSGRLANSKLWGLHDLAIFPNPSSNLPTYLIRMSHFMESKLKTVDLMPECSMERELKTAN